MDALGCESEVYYQRREGMTVQRVKGVVALAGTWRRGKDSVLCMEREFREETTLGCESRDLFAVERSQGNDADKVYYFRGRVPDEASRPATPGINDSGEMLGWMPVQRVLLTPGTR